MPVLQFAIGYLLPSIPLSTRYRSFVLPKSEGALASASSPGRARSVAMQISFACREADANQVGESVWARVVMWGYQYNSMHHLMPTHTLHLRTTCTSFCSLVRLFRRVWVLCLQVQAAWVRNLDAAQVELAEKRALAPQEAMGGHASAQEVQQRQARSLVLVLDGLRSAENVGNLFRTAEVSTGV